MTSGRPGGPLSPDDERHGSTAGYRAGCREECCREPANRASRERKRRRTARLKAEAAKPKPSDGMAAYYNRNKRYKVSNSDLALGFVSSCETCHHAPGFHMAGQFPSDPRPCEAPGCSCSNFQTETITGPDRVKDWGWSGGSDPFGVRGARRLA